MRVVCICRWWGFVVLVMLGCAGVQAENAAPEPTTPSSPVAAQPVESNAETQVASTTTDDGLGCDAARWRVELTATTAYHSGRRSRTGDYALRSNIEYEIPVLKHMTVSPRIIPLMYYNENGKGDSTFWAFGFGVALRGYSKPDQTGWFGEGGIHLLGQTGKFEGNTGSFNFMEEVGVGYMFKNGVSAAVKVNHMSNAGLAEDNAGCNTVGLGLGYRFKR